MTDNTTNSRPINTNRQNYVFLYIIIGMLLIAGLIFLFKSSFFDKSTIDAKILKEEIYLNEDMVYTDNTKNAKKWLWEFGNGDRSTTQNGSYRFKKAGSYIVRITVDGKLQQQFPLSVKDTVTAVVDTMITTSGPTFGMVNEEIRIEATGKANIFEWSFGETNRVDAKGRTALYTYHNPGLYYIKLITDKSKRPIYHIITITGFPQDSAVVIKDDGEKKGLDDIRARLQKIANGYDFNENYTYIVKKYLCGNEKVTVNIDNEGEKKQIDFYSYCMRLTFGKGTIIDEAQVTVSPNTTCVSLLNIKQHSTNPNPQSAKPIKK